MKLRLSNIVSISTLLMSVSTHAQNHKSVPQPNSPSDVSTQSEESLAPQQNPKGIEDVQFENLGKGVSFVADDELLVPANSKTIYIVGGKLYSVLPTDADGKFEGDVCKLKLRAASAQTRVFKKGRRIELGPVLGEGRVATNGDLTVEDITCIHESVDFLHRSIQKPINVAKARKALSPLFSISVDSLQEARDPAKANPGKEKPST